MGCLRKINWMYILFHVCYYVHLEDTMIYKYLSISTRDKADLVSGCVRLGWFRPDSNPGRPRELFQIHVAMSRVTNWPPKLSTNMVIDHFTLNIQPCMIHICVRSKILVKMIHQSYIKKKSISRYLAIFWIPRYWRKLYKRRGVQMFQIEIKIKMPKCKTLSLVY